MIRFVDLRRVMPPRLPTRREVPACAFLDTFAGTFVQARDGSHLFTSADDIPPGSTGDRCRLLLPPGFFG